MTKKFRTKEHQRQSISKEYNEQLIIKQYDEQWIKNNMMNN